MSVKPHFLAPVLLALWAVMAPAAGDALPGTAKPGGPDASAAASAGLKPRLFEVPRIDKSKAEDPFKGQARPVAAAEATAPAAPAPKPAIPAVSKPARAVAATPGARPVLKLPGLDAARELTRQQRELMLATSGPRKTTGKAKVEADEKPTIHDYSHVHWSYSGPGAPENWGKLNGGVTCGIGKRQSPIDIRDAIRVDLEPIRFDYRPTQFRITDNGHTIEVDVAEGNTISVMGRTWQLVQFHFHRPSEERINGKSYEMVVHLVHRDYANNLAVVAVLMERGMEHPVVQTLWNHLPLDTGMSVEPPDVAIDLTKLLPERRDYYTYMGSLTTPPCTEGVLWMVFKEPIPVSPEQIGIFARLYPHNARPIQPTHDRLIKESR